VLLVDCHSMPSSATQHVLPPGEDCVDIVLGDRFGASCDESITELAEELFISAGLRVIRNKPYAGGFITQNHGAPLRGRHALQIEVDRALYLDELQREPGPNLTNTAAIVHELLALLSEQVNGGALPLAAE